MSELINTKNNRNDLRWKLLTTVSALVLIGSLSTTPNAKADDDTDGPTVWIELGGQLSRLNDSQESFDPVFANTPARPSIFSPSSKFEKPPAYSFDEFGTISFQPESSDWIFSASVHYGRSASKGDVRQQTHPKSAYTKFSYFISYNPNNIGHGAFYWAPLANKFADTNAQIGERHSILDFQAGKDVGLGRFGGTHGSSALSLGIRFAQFSSTSNIALKSDPDWHFNYKYFTYAPAGLNHIKFVSAQPYHNNAASLTAQRNFHGLGPSISWKASAPFAGNAKNGELVLDWSVNAAFLFGKQKMNVHHQTTAKYFRTIVGTPVNTNHARSRNVIVPNIGGSVGLSWQLQNFKMNFGYKADFFFGAIDGGIDTVKSENRGFYGPFASVSVGLGG